MSAHTREWASLIPELIDTGLLWAMERLRDDPWPEWCDPELLALGLAEDAERSDGIPLIVLTEDGAEILEEWEATCDEYDDTLEASS